LFGFALSATGYFCAIATHISIIALSVFERGNAILYTSTSSRIINSLILGRLPQAKTAPEMLPV
jgi:hypothetical protein